MNNSEDLKRLASEIMDEADANFKARIIA